MSYQEFIKAELLILIPVLYIIGVGLKKSKMKDKYIPIILGLISITLSSIWIFSTEDITSVREIAYALFTAITQGVLAAGASVYANQIYIQTKNK